MRGPSAGPSRGGLFIAVQTDALPTSASTPASSLQRGWGLSRPLPGPQAPPQAPRSARLQPGRLGSQGRARTRPFAVLRGGLDCSRFPAEPFPNVPAAPGAELSPLSRSVSEPQSQGGFGAATHPQGTLHPEAGRGSPSLLGIGEQVPFVL